ncbi:MAG: hypothetical protein J6Q77_02595 [Clostridia bacterium]|nr:hypothetical protein [Clostridia bacterium]
MNNSNSFDKNLIVETKLNKDDIKFYSVLSEPFRIYGLTYDHEDKIFKRIPTSVAEQMSEHVMVLHLRTAGGRVRFVTDSAYIAISAKMPAIYRASNFSLSGSASFDMYVKKNGVEKYNNTFTPPYGMTDGYESIFEFKTKEMREVTINFPLYSSLSELYIGLQEGTEVKEASPYTYDKPVVFYGSSITQGACASRAGNAYSAMVSRRFDCDFINLGFSGNAKAEPAIAEYIAGLDMTAFVYDYDHNASSVEYLRSTHKRMFDTVRSANPDLPIIMMSSVSLPRVHDDRDARIEVIRDTYRSALDAGDKNVYFINGAELFADIEDIATIEGCHPNDIGFLYMANAVGDVLEKILK